MRGMYAGWHLTLDCLVESPDAISRLGDREYLETFLRDLTGVLGMSLLGGPYMHDVACDPQMLENDDDDDGGITGVAVISTSHVSIHTWPLRKCFSLDVFSCREFKEDVVQDFVRARLGFTRRASHWIVRNWP